MSHCPNQSSRRLGPINLTIAIVLVGTAMATAAPIREAPPTGLPTSPQTQTPAQPQPPAPVQAPAQTQPTETQPAAQTQPTARSMEVIVHEYSMAGDIVRAGLPGMHVPPDAAQRAAAAARVIPDMRKMAKLLDEMGIAEPRAKYQARQVKQELTAVMALLGDAEAMTTLKKLAVSTDREEAASAKAWLIVMSWDKARGQPTTQEKLADDYSTLARANPENEVMAQAASLLIEQAATPTLGEEVEQVVIDDLKSPMSRDLSGSIGRARKLRALLNQPMTVKGTTFDGHPFTSADWKGNVVLVDFWATWCPPCMAEMPRLKKLYHDHHAQGFNIIGVTSDRDPDNFKAFLADNREVLWPQLFDAATVDLHPLAKQFGIDRLPTMFLIDRKGMVRSVTADTDLETLLPKLLAESIRE